MKKSPIYFLLLMIMFSACTMESSNTTGDEIDTTEAIAAEPENETAPPPSRTDTFALGTIADKKSNVKAVVIAPELMPGKGDATECHGDCASIIRFGAGLPELKVDSSLGGKVFNVGDLNGNGTSEILFVPEWFSSCWGGMNVYSLINNKWEKVGSGSIYTCKKIDYKARVKKGTNSYFILVEDVIAEDGAEMVQAEKKIYFKAQSNP